MAGFSALAWHVAPPRRGTLACCLSLLAVWSSAATAQSQSPGGTPPPEGMSLAASAAMRYPQPVRAGNLLHEDVLQPVESQNLLGTVADVVRQADGTIDVVIDFGGFLGFGTRPIAVPLDAMVLDGQVMEVVAFTPAQLRQLPTFSPAGTTPVPPGDVIKVGLAKPSH